MRLFVALPLDPGARRAVGERIAAERGALPPARWVHPENLHLTLAFLGDVDAERVEELASALAPALAGHLAIRMRLQGAGCFPAPSPEGRRRPARVAWIGLETDGEDGDLRSIQAAAATAATAAVDYRPDRPWSPHLTLARPRPPWPAPDSERFASVFAPPVGDGFVADRAVLIASELGGGPGGSPLYRDVGSFPLAPRPAVAMEAGR